MFDKQKRKKWLQEEFRYGFAAFMIPALIMIGIYLSLGIYPGSERTVLASDSFSQFSNFHASFNNMLRGKQSFLFTWNASLGLNYLALASYYLGGIFTPLVVFFNNAQMPDALYFLTLLKIGAAGLAFWYYAKETFRLRSRWAYVVLAVPYALSSFALALSEIIMWLDTFVFLPLIILGINRILAKKKPTLLFWSYFIFFITNFYMAFMVGLFSFLYFTVRLLTDFKEKKKTIVPYLLTSFAAGIASMVIILPTILDLRTNGETLTRITTLKTEATGFWDILIKNMIGIYDTTKYGSIPFIYIGLLPLIFCLYYFVSKKIPTKEKIAYGTLIAILVASFYLQPLNLFWQGMHAPNMFLFRFSFLFSFMLIMLAGYGWEKFQQKDLGYLVGTILVLMIGFIMAMVIGGKNYNFVSDISFYITLLFLAIYLVAIAFYQLQQINWKKLCILLLLAVSGEAAINAHGMLNGILTDWNYPSRSLYATPAPAIQKSVETANKLEGDQFFRLENLDGVSANDSFNYGYSGISMFSSIRNRNSSALLNQLGFRSQGTNLNIRYANNTLLADALTGVRYNIAKADIQKFGYKQVSSAKEFQLFQNQYALPLGVMTSKEILTTKIPANDNLGTQQAIYQTLAGTNHEYFRFTDPSVTGQNNTKLTERNNVVTYAEQTPNISKEITMSVYVPANQQAYLSLFPSDFSLLKSSTAEITVNGISSKEQIGITGQYYNLGYYEEATQVTFTIRFYGTEKVSFIKPRVLLLDTETFKEDTKAIQAKGISFKKNKRGATAKAEVKEDGVLFTSIPYDKGWQAYVDNQKTTITAFQNGFVTIPIKKGTHTIKFVYTPQGFPAGIALLILGISIFYLYLYRSKIHDKLFPKRRSQRTQKEAA